MSGPAPRVVVLWGVNGAGKSTAARGLLADHLRVPTFVNADEIARGLCGFDPGRVAFEAGRVMLRRLEELAARREEFAFESTLAGRTYLRFLRQCRGAGYRVEVYYFWLPSVELAIQRVSERVRRGGHAIPEGKIRQRYTRSMHNFWFDYRMLADQWQVFDNGGASPVPIALGSGIGGRDANAPWPFGPRAQELSDDTLRS